MVVRKGNLLRVLLWSLILSLVFAVRGEAKNEREYIIVSGGPALHEWEKFKPDYHDRWWGNFIRPARVRIQELRAEHGAGARITWLVYRRGYERRAERMSEPAILSNILSVRDRYGVNLIWFRRGEEVVAYLNSGQPRDRVKIANFEYFGHSNRACFMFDYSNEIDSASKSWLHEDELWRLKRGIFTRDAFIKSWGCHTGESMSKKWRAATGRKMIGAIGKTDYSKMYLNNWRPVLSAGGKWAW
ncbi:MAG: hypothetical protein N2035_09595 [Chthoniobacterales bacterium]|nr:hypothetical protein [Chthoniobacterales bacterium]MCX7713894.1 hypothetical protein [Chthoniobacterales bacterium]